MITYQFTVNQTAQTRRIKHDGVEYLVVPVVALKAGLLNGEQVPADEVDAFPESWNGRPVVVGHPEQDGVKVSANSPSILSHIGLGQLYNANADNGKLKAEMWIDVAKAKRLGGDALEALQRFERGESTEVSTAYWRDKDGNTARNLRPDHLAVLLHERGACSWQDGCGAPRVNQEQGEAMETNAMSEARRPTFDGTSAGEWSAPTLDDYLNAYPGDKPEERNVAELPTEVKRWIARHSLLGHPQADNLRDLTLFPVVGTDGKLYASALRAVLGGRGSQAQIPDAAKESAQEVARDLLDREFKTNTVVNALRSLAARLGFGLRANQDGQSHTQRVERVSQAWEAEFVKDDDGRPYRYVEDVLEEAVIVTGDPQGILSYPYSLQDDGGIEFSAPVVVKKIYQEVNVMNELIQQILADGRFGLNEDELSGLSEAVLTKLAAGLGAQQEPDEEEEEEEMAEQVEHIPAANQEQLELASELPPALTQLSEAMEKRGGVDVVLGLLDGLQANGAAHKAELVGALVANDASAFSKEQLEAMPAEHLEALQLSLTPPDYTGQGGGPTIAVNEIQRLEMPDLFAVPSLNGGK